MLLQQRVLCCSGLSSGQWSCRFAISSEFAEDSALALELHRRPRDMMCLLVNLCLCVIHRERDSTICEHYVLLFGSIML